MHRVAAIDSLRLRVNLQIAHLLVAIMIQYDVYWSVLLRCDAEDGCMAATCHLYLQMFLGQTYGIVMGMRYLLLMREWGGALFGL